VRAGVNDSIVDEVPRQIGIIRVAVEGELEDPGARNMELVAQGPHVWSDYPQILGDEWQAAQFTLHCPEKAGARSWYPLPRLGG
jgi:hypothetical protein